MAQMKSRQYKYSIMSVNKYIQNIDKSNKSSVNKLKCKHIFRHFILVIDAY